MVADLGMMAETFHGGIRLALTIAKLNLSQCFRGGKANYFAQIT